MRPPQVAGNSSAGILGDADIARNPVTQAEQMKAQMATLQAEAERLMEEALFRSRQKKKKKRGLKGKKHKWMLNL